MVRLTWSFIAIVLYLSCFQNAYANQKNEICNEHNRVKVKATIEVLDIRNINTYDHTFDIDFYLLLQWNPLESQHLDSDTSTQGKWRPIPDFINAISLDNKTPDNYSQTEQVSPTSKIFDGRYSGKFTSYMNFRQFPHDTQILKVILEDYDMSEKCMIFDFGGFKETTKKSKNDQNSHPLSTKKTDYLPEVTDSLVDWQLIEISTDVAPKTYKYLEDGTYSQAILQVELERLPQYYNFKIVSICFIITIISWLAMALSPASLGERTAISVTSLLALVAHNYVSTDMLPKIPYLTALDTILLGTQLLVFISALENLLVYMIHKKSSHPSKSAICDRIDTISFLIFSIMLFVFFYAYLNGISIGG